MGCSGGAFRGRCGVEGRLMRMRMRGKVRRVWHVEPMLDEFSIVY